MSSERNLLDLLTATERRTLAAAHVHSARKNLREAAKHLDGLGATAHKNVGTAIIACDDTMDAIVGAESIDRQLADLERIS